MFQEAKIREAIAMDQKHQKDQMWDQKHQNRPNVDDAGMEFIVVLCLYYKSLLCSQWCTCYNDFTIVCL